MNKGARKVNIAVDDKSKSWKNIKSSIFPEYFFHCTVDEQENTEEGAKITMDLIENNQNLLTYNDVGGDPYLRPFLYLYVADIPNKGISQNMKDSIDKWIEKNKMAMTTYLVILIQDDRTFAPKIIKSTELPNDENILFIRYNKNRPLQNTYIEDIRNATRDAIVKDFNAYNSEGKERIHHLSSNTIAQMRLKIWRNLLLFSFGFCDTAFKGFSKLYNKMIIDSHFDCSLDDLLKIEIDLVQITDHPNVSDNTVYSIISFALQGVFAVSYNRLKFENISTYFFKQYSLVRSKCKTAEDHKKANEWGEKTIDTLLKLPQFITQTNVSSHMLFKKFLLMLESSDINIESVYDEYRNLLRGFKSTVVAMDTLYVLYFQKRPKQLDIENMNQFIGWNIASEATKIIVNSIIERGDFETVFKLAQPLLSDRSSIKDKKEIFEKLVSFDKSYVYESLFRVNFSFESDAFQSEVPAGRPFIINAKFRGPQWIPENFDDAILQLKITRQGKIDKFSTNAQTLKKIMSFQAFFGSPGTRDFSEFSLQYGKIVLKWTINTVYQIIVGNHVNVPIHLDTPRIIVPSKPLTMLIKLDFSNIMVANFQQYILFEDNNAYIPEQEGEITYTNSDNDETKLTCKYSINKEGVVSLMNKSDNSEFLPSLKILTMPITFMVKNLTNEKSKLIVNMKMNHHKVSNQFSVLCNFPLKINIRLKTEEVIHLALQNVCDIPLTINNEDIGETVIDSDTEIFIIHPTNKELFTVTVSGLIGEKITQTWNINDDILYPKIKLEFENKETFLVGSTIDAHLKIPKSKFRFIQNSDFVIIGMINCPNFTGGNINVKFIPIKVGKVETPNIEINDVVYTLHPRFIQVTSSSALSLGPFVSDQDVY